MFLKFFLFTLILHVVVQVSCVEPQKVLSKQETIAESENDTKSEQKVDESATENSEITLSLNGSDILPTTIIVSDLPTSALLSEAEESAGELEEVTVATTALDGGSYTNETAAESDSETTTTNLPTANTEPAHETVTGDLSEAITDPVNGTVAVDSTENNANASGETLKTEETTISESDVTDGDMVTNSTTTPTTEFPATPTNSTSPTTTESPDTSTNSTTTPESPATPTPTSTSTTTTTTTETPTTPIDILCPQVNEDPKYRNETFDLNLAEFMKKNPLAKVYKSPGFPDPYAENLNCTLSVTLTNCTGIDVVVHYLDLDPFEHDSLRIRAGDENDTDEVGKELTGQKFGISLKIIHSTSLYVQFESGSHGAGVYRGFLLTYSPYGNDTIPPTTTEAPITVPPSRVEFYQVQLVLPKINRKNTTWERFKDVLAGSASKYVSEVNLNYTLAHPDNVTINVYDCPDNWPNYENCVQLRFSITLWNKAYDPNIHYDLSIFEYELSTNSLSNMWDLYGRYDFLDILQVEEYSIPDGTYIFLLWTGISLTIVVIFIGVLYSIWRIDIFREYRRMHNRSDDQQDILKSKSELDISMYPIPHQPYPTLFETTEMNSGGYYDSHETSSTTFHQGHSFQDGLTNYRHSINTPFTPNIMDFNDTQLFPDDEENFGRVQPLSPRSQQKLLVLGAKRDESNT